MKLLSFKEYNSKLSEYENYKTSISENITYHIDNKLSLSESIFRIGSDSYCDFVNELRALNSGGLIKLSDNDKFIVENLKTGQKGIYKDKSVNLDTPRRTTGDEPGKFIVFRDSGKKTKDGKIKAVKITWGDTNSTVKNCDDDARKSFLARHQCDEKTLTKDGMSPGWWACNIHRFWKQLGLTCDKPW